MDLLALYIIGFIITWITGLIDLAYHTTDLGYDFGLLEVLVTFLIALGSWISLAAFIWMYIDAIILWIKNEKGDANS